MTELLVPRATRRSRLFVQTLFSWTLGDPSWGGARTIMERIVGYLFNNYLEFHIAYTVLGFDIVLCYQC